MEIIGAIRHYLLPSAISAAVICGIWFFVCCFLSKRASWHEWLARLFLMMLVSAMLILTEGYRVFTGDLTTMFLEPNLTPIVRTIEDFASNPGGVTEQLLYNVALFIPFGFLLPLSFRDADWRLWKLLLIAAAVVLSVELLELFAGRYFDIDDLFVNCLGAAIGYGLYYGAVRLYERAFGVEQTETAWDKNMRREMRRTFSSVKPSAPLPYDPREGK